MYDNKKSTISLRIFVDIILDSTKIFWCKNYVMAHHIVSRKSVLVTLMKYSKDSKLGAFNV